MLGLIVDLIEGIKLFIAEWLSCFAKALGFSSGGLEDVISAKGRAAALRNQEIEERLRNYPNDLISSFGWDTGDETEAADEVLRDEVLDSEKRKDLSKRLANSFRQIRGYQTLCNKVEETRLIKYDAMKREHEELLLRLWKLLMPEEELVSRRSLQWQEIGFQGDDPSTDFRGMGLLGLEQLVFFAQFDVDNCRRVLSIANHPVNGFPFAVCGIAMTSLVKELLMDSMLKNHFYNTFEQKPSMDAYNQAYCRIFTLFGEFWLHSKPANVMEFNTLRRKFTALLERYLERPDAHLRETSLQDIMEGVESGAT